MENIIFCEMTINEQRQQAYVVPYQKSVMEIFVKIVNI